MPLNWEEHPDDLPRQFSDRSALECALQQLFPEASGSLSPI
ncbi:MAG: deoxyribodipyrimidine photo-lyase, partial [Synechococcaceae bacterium WB7_3xG_012]|nr:deoxyribodipyrimidine photo-lyase [Synechococcaceae bacterium WB7_3xG_012]